MNTKHTKVSKVRECILRNPTLIGTLIKDTSINRGMIYRLLRKALPCRIGIEFELSGHFIESFKKKYGDVSPEKLYNVLSVEGDDKRCLSPEDIYEIRISIVNYSQLSGLYRFMKDLNEFCKIHEHGGIHIHVDISDVWSEGNCEIMRNYSLKRLDVIGSIFPKYTGKYNRRTVKIREKSCWLNISRLHTLEFRIAPLTFDYSTLIRWVLDLVRFRNRMISECRLKKIKNKTISKSSKYAFTESGWVDIDSIVSHIDDTSYISHNAVLDNISVDPDENTANIGLYTTASPTYTTVTSTGTNVYIGNDYLTTDTVTSFGAM